MCFCPVLALRMGCRFKCICSDRYLYFTFNYANLIINIRINSIVKGNGQE